MEQMFQEETAGFAPHFASNNVLRNIDSDLLDEPLLECMGVSDIESVNIQGCTFQLSALQNLIRPPRKKPDLIAYCGEDAIAEYNNPHLMMGMFLLLYPYGKGGFEDSEQIVPVSFCSQANLYLDLSDRVFRWHNSFIFIVMNMIQRCEAHLHTHLAVKSSNFAATAADIKGVTPHTLHSVSHHLEEQGRSADLTMEEKKVFTLLSKVRIISVKITGSEVLKITYRNEIKAYCAHFNIPHIYFTANPDPANSPIFQVVVGDTMVDLDEQFPHMVDYVKCTLRLAANPVAALDFFNFSCKAMMHYLFGWDFAKKHSSPDGGILGHLKAFYGTMELTERGSCHIHYLIILLGGLNPSDMHHRLDDTEDFQDRFFAFYEDIICHNLPEDIYFNPKGKPKTETFSCSRG